jgi:hypothetical protein
VPVCCLDQLNLDVAKGMRIRQLPCMLDRPQIDRSSTTDVTLLRNAWSSASDMALGGFKAPIASTISSRSLSFSLLKGRPTSAIGAGAQTRVWQQRRG